LHFRFKFWDLSNFDRQIKDLFKEKIKTLESEVSKFETLNYNFDKINNSVKSNLIEIQNENEQIKNLAKSVNLKTMIAIGSGSFFLGMILMSGLGLQLLKDKVYQDTINAKNEYIAKKNELDNKYANASALEKIARKINLKYEHNKNGKFVFIDTDKVENAYSNEKFQVWKLK